MIADTVVTNNQIGISACFAVGTLDHVMVFQNSRGVYLQGGAAITAVDTVVSKNSGNGFEIMPSAGGASSISLAHSTATGNGTDVNGVGFTSFGDNHINSVKGTLTKVPLQ